MVFLTPSGKRIKILLIRHFEFWGCPNVAIFRSSNFVRQQSSHLGYPLSAANHRKAMRNVSELLCVTTTSVGMHVKVLPSVFFCRFIFAEVQTCQLLCCWTLGNLLHAQSRNLTHHLLQRLTSQLLAGHTFTSYLFGYVSHTHDPETLPWFIHETFVTPMCLLFVKVFQE